jgi:PAS domain-containing protein
VRAAIHEARRTKRTFELEHRVHRLDGTLGWVFSRAIPILNEQGDIIEWFAAASDVTERMERAASEARALREREAAEKPARQGQKSRGNGRREKSK